MKTRSEQALDTVSDIRRKNNDLWMAILGIAIESQPERTRDLIKQISNNDKEVTKWLERV